MSHSGPCNKIFSGEFTGNVTAPRFRWICEGCLEEGQDPPRLGMPPQADPVRYTELRAQKDGVLVPLFTPSAKAPYEVGCG